MKKTLFIYISIIPYILCGQQVEIFYDQNSNKFLVSDSYYGTNPYLIEIRTGYPPNAISINYINKQKDTISVFNSFSCSQYSIFNNKLCLYFWLNEAGYASTDCICIDEFNPDIACRPDTSDAIVKFYFQFIGENLKLKISNFNNPFKNTFSEDLERIKEIVNSFDKNKLIPLTDSNNKNYNPTLEDINFLIGYYYSFSFYCLINNKLSILKLIDNYIIENYNILINSDYFNCTFIKYCQNLRKYIWANKGKSYFISKNNFTTLYKLSKKLSDPPFCY